MINPKPLILVGGGGHCKSVIEAAKSAGLTIMGILDVPSNIGKKVLDIEIVGTDEDIPLYVNECEFIVTIGFIKDSAIRVNLHQLIENGGGKLGKIIASTAHVSEYAEVGDGSVVLHGAMVNAGARIGKGCIINTLACIEHDSIIGDYCHISTGSIINGDCIVGEKTFLGSQSVMVHSTQVPANSVFSAGAVVHKSISEPGIYIGNPVKIKE